MSESVEWERLDDHVEAGAPEPVPIRLRSIPDQLDHFSELLAPLLARDGVDRETLLAVGATIVNLGAIAAQLRKATPSGPLHPDDAAVAEVRAWLPEGTPDNALIELEAHTLRGVLAVLDQWEQNARNAAAQRNAAEGTLERAKVDMRLLREDVGDANKRADAAGALKRAAYADRSAAIERADEAERELAELRIRGGAPETVWGHQVHGDDGWAGEAVPQASEAAARALVEHMNTKSIRPGDRCRAKLVVHEVWHAETEWRVVEDDAQ